MLDCDCNYVKCLAKNLNKQVAQIKIKVDIFIKAKNKKCVMSKKQKTYVITNIKYQVI